MLEEAVKQCMGAAQYEYDPQTQKSLLRVSPRLFTLLCSAFAQALSVMLLPYHLLTRQRRSESVFWLISAQIHLWRPAENCEC